MLTEMTHVTTNAPDLKTRWQAFRTENPTVRIRNAAAAMGVSEAELLAADLGDGVARLTDDWTGIVKALESVGDVMALTRNDACVHEKTGVYRNFTYFETHKIGQLVDELIDLRIFFSKWRYGFAVETPWEGGKGGVRRSLQFFDGSGHAVHKVFLNRKSDVAAYEALVAAFRAEEAPPLAVEPAEPRAPDRPDAEIDRPGLLKAWSELQDTHDYFLLLGTFGVGRQQALRLAKGVFTERATLDAPRLVLDRAAESGLPIMVFVGNHGCIQIHTGPVKTLKEHGDWYNVLDPGFNLHLDENAIDAAWIVRKPTSDGIVTSLEVFDKAGELIVQFFGKRKPGLPELEEWRGLVAGLPRAGVPA